MYINGDPSATSRLPKAKESPIKKGLAQILADACDAFNALPADGQSALMELAGKKPGAALVKLMTHMDISEVATLPPRTIAIGIADKFVSELGIPDQAKSFVTGLILSKMDTIEPLITGILSSLQEE